MPTPTKGPRLGGGPAHERLMLANLATSLFEHDRITTTEAKAKRLRPLAERLVTFAKRGDLHSRRRVLTVVKDKGVVHRLFAEIAPDMELRAGGYTRITKVGTRKGDNAPMAVIELVREPLSARKATVKEAEGATRRAAKQAEATTAASDTKTVEDTGATVDADHPVDVKERPLFDGPEAPGDTEGTPVDAPTGDGTDGTDGTGVSEGEYGAGSAAPNEDGSAPAGYDIKGNKDSMKYHEPDGQWYDQTVAEVWFKTAADAEKAGFEKAGGSH